MEKKTRHTWTRSETLAFLDAYYVRKDEFLNVLEDLISKGIFKEAITTEVLQIKIKNLLKAYKSAKDAATKTGAGRIEAPFEEQMDAICGDRPICTNTKTITLNGQKTHALKEKINKEVEITEEAAVDEENTDNQKLPKKRQKISNFRIEKIDILKEYLDKKIELKKIAEEGRERRHQEKLKMLSDFLNVEK